MLKWWELGLMLWLGYLVYKKFTSSNPDKAQNIKDKIKGWFKWPKKKKTH